MTTLSFTDLTSTIWITWKSSGHRQFSLMAGSLLLLVHRWVWNPCLPQLGGPCQNPPPKNNKNNMLLADAMKSSRGLSSHFPPPPHPQQTKPCALTAEPRDRISAGYWAITWWLNAWRIFQCFSKFYTNGRVVATKSYCCMKSMKLRCFWWCCYHSTLL